MRRLDDADLGPGLERRRRDVHPVRPPSSVRQIRPSSVPTQIAVPDWRRSDVVDHAAPRPLEAARRSPSTDRGWRDAGIVARQVGADRVQVWPPSAVRNRRWLPK